MVPLGVVEVIEAVEVNIPADVVNSLASAVELEPVPNDGDSDVSVSIVSVIVVFAAEVSLVTIVVATEFVTPVLVPDVGISLANAVELEATEGVKVSNVPD